MANRKRSESKERYWRGQVAGWESSGLGIRAYCQQQGLNEPCFYAWRRELVRRDHAAGTPLPIKQHSASLPSKVASSVSWMPLTVTEGARSDIEVQWPSGVQLRIPLNMETLEHLLTVLQRSVA